MLEKVIENWTSRLDYIRASRGSPMPEIIFKIKIKSVSQIRIQIPMPHPETHLVPTFGASAPESYSPKGGSSIIVRLSLISDSCAPPRKTLAAHFAQFKNFQFPRARHHSKRRRRWVGVKGSTRNGCRDPICLSARRFHMVRQDTGSPIEDATCAWMAADEAVGCTRAFLTMWWSSRLLVCRGRPEPDLRVNGIS
ncbi:uncharacterized protein TNCV_1051851 [Trichonephila clavipes]|nr:uncharacterized protein TNCV_1051851 [Trichonephila clavipes]